MSSMHVSRVPAITMAIYYFLFAAIVASWFVNIIKLVSCDFEEPFGEEIIYLIGLIGPASIITCWF